MNIAFDPWIPVITTQGERKFVSLSTLFTEGNQLADLVVRPHERVSLLRLFICIAHAAADGPKNYDEWLNIPTTLAEAVLRYLTQWKDSFEFFHPVKPWLQVPSISDKQNTSPDWENISAWTPASNLCLTYSSGHNPTLFDHMGGQERLMPIEMVIISLLSFQCFSPGGTTSVVFWHGKKINRYSSDSPCISTSMLHAFLRGENVLSTICLNMPTYSDIKRIYPELGQPLWEMMPTSFEDDVAIRNATQTYLGRLVPLSRLVLIHPKKPYMLLGNGLDYPKYSDSFPQEPTATVVMTHDKKRAILSYDPAKSIFRQLAAIIVKRDADNIGGPLSLRNIGEDADFDLQVCALAHKQGSLLDAFESVVTIPRQLATQEGQNTYDAEITRAENIFYFLGNAIEKYRQEIDSGWEEKVKNAGPKNKIIRSILRSHVANFYWTAVEKNITLLLAVIRALGTDETGPRKKEWHKFLASTAYAAYRSTTANDTPRQVLAFATGWHYLTNKVAGFFKEKEDLGKEEDDE